MPNSVRIVPRSAVDRATAARPSVGEESRRLRRGVQAQPLARPGDHVQGDDVVGGPAVAQRPRSAGVVADHAADRAAGVGGRVGPEPQPVRRGRRAAASAWTTPGSTTARSAPRGRSRRSGSGAAPMSTTRPGPTALPAQDVPAPRVVTGMPSARAASSTASQLVDRTRAGDRLRHDPVERGVGGVERPGERGRVQDVGQIPARAAPSDRSDVCRPAAIAVMVAIVWSLATDCVSGSGLRGCRSVASMTAAKARPSAA